MRPEDYPPQEPFTAIGALYHARVIGLADAVGGIEWQHGADPYQSAVLYPAERPRGDVVALIHGGGWTNGYKEWMAFMAPALTGRGILVASLGYRLAPRIPGPRASRMSQTGWHRSLGGWPRFWPCGPTGRQAAICQPM